MEIWEVAGLTRPPRSETSSPASALTDDGPGPQSLRTENCKEGAGQAWRMPQIGQSGTFENVYTGMYAEGAGVGDAVQAGVCHGDAAENWSVSKR